MTQSSALLQELYGDSFSILEDLHPEGLRRGAAVLLEPFGKIRIVVSEQECNIGNTSARIRQQRLRPFQDFMLVKITGVMPGQLPDHITEMGRMNAHLAGDIT